MAPATYTRNADGTITVTMPDGRTFTTRRRSAAEIQQGRELMESYHATFRAAEQASADNVED